MNVNGELGMTRVAVAAPEGRCARPEDVGGRAKRSQPGYVPASDVLQPHTWTLGTSRENLS